MDNRRQAALRLPASDYRQLFAQLGPSLGLWRAAEVAALRQQRASLAAPVLDLGCGDGLVTALVLDRVALGVDPNGGELAKAAARGVYGRLMPAAIERCGLPESSLATIVSNSVLEHILNIDEVLAVAARLLRPGGYLVFTVPTESFGAWLALPSRRYSRWRNGQLRHYNLWPIAAWQAHLARAGFRIELAQPYLRRSLVAGWDALELLQQVRIGRRRAFGLLWRRLPAPALDSLAQRAAQLDLSAGQQGGGRLVVARRV